MPLHDWNDPRGWEGVHDLWLVELLHWLKPRLPEPYRVYIGSTPALSMEAVQEKPDVAVRQWEPRPSPAPSRVVEPDYEGAVAMEVDPQKALHIKARGQLISAIELISPCNKDRPESRANSLARYRNYLLDSVHLLLVDVHRRPLTFSFTDALNEAISLERPPMPAPHAVVYRMGEPLTEGRLVAIWQRALAVGQPLPTLPLPLSVHLQIDIDLEGTYRRAAEAAYLD